MVTFTDVGQFSGGRGVTTSALNPGSNRVTGVDNGSDILLVRLLEVVFIFRNDSSRPKILEFVDWNWFWCITDPL
jgi:hypothetical protein